MLSPRADNYDNGWQPRAGKHATCQSPVWSPGVRVESRRPKSRPGASTGVHVASRS
jgi:hypothetical protein